MYSSRVGAEAVDPRGWSCEVSYKCRYSDANIVRTSAAVDVGYIARTTGVGNGSVTIDPAQPRLTIVSTSVVYGGDTVYMLGRTSGMLCGTVTHTCGSFKKIWEGRWHKVLCTNVSNYNSQGGDSGSPVFKWSGTSEKVSLAGIHFARNSIEDHAFFSPIGGIERDLGTLEPRAPGYRSPTYGGGGTGGCTDPADCPEPK